MANSFEFTGKKVEDAINEGLKSLHVTIDEVDVEILSQGGFLKKAKVRLTLENSKNELKVQEKTDIEPKKAKGEEKKSAINVKNDIKIEDKGFKSEAKKDILEDKGFKSEVKKDILEDKRLKQDFRQELKVDNKSANAKPQEIKKTENKEFNNKKPVEVDRQQQDEKFFKENSEAYEAASKAAVDFLTKTLALMNIEAKIEKQNGLNFEIFTESSAVIGYRGETLDSLQYMTRLAVNKGDEKFMRINLDCNKYREKRQATLTGLAHKMAEKCVKNGHKVTLEPMESIDRHTIHAALSSDERVMTRSEGHEPNRRVVVLVKRDSRPR